ncbi:MAG: alpha/beta hydrolase [Paraperlucidibaca sp.]
MTLKSLRLSSLLLGLMVITSPVQASMGLWVQETALGLEQHLANLDRSTYRVDNHDIVVFSRHTDSQQPCIVMIHGFTARAAHWFRMAKALPAERCIIAMDLPGFGQSSFLPTAAYDTPTQADRVSNLIKAIAPKNPQVDLIGNSMGGAISAQFALRHPKQTHSLTLMNAAGVSSPTLSTLRKQIAEGKNGFFATNLDGWKHFYDMTMSEPPFVPSFILDAVAAEAIARVPRHEYIFNQLGGVMDASLGKIHTPTLIIWGAQDQLLDVSMVTVWQRIAGAKAYIFKGVGHMPHLEQPKQSAELYTRFLAGELK